jgi:hypothetical protein
MPSSAARAGQFVDPVSFQALMLFDPMGDKLAISPPGARPLAGRL